MRQNAAIQTVGVMWASPSRIRPSGPDAKKQTEPESAGPFSADPAPPGPVLVALGMADPCLAP